MLRQADVNGSDKPDISYDSISRLNDTPTLNEDYVRAGSPSLGKEKLLEIKNGDGMRSYGETLLKNSDSNGKILIYHRAFGSWKELAFTLVHEYRHRMHYVTGNFQKWKQLWGYEAARSLTEFYAYRWEMYSRGILNDNNSTLKEYKADFNRRSGGLNPIIRY